MGCQIGEIGVIQGPCELWIILTALGVITVIYFILLFYEMAGEKINEIKKNKK